MINGDSTRRKAACHRTIRCSLLEARRTEFWVHRYIEDQARNYLYALDRAIDVDYIIAKEPLAQTYIITSCKEIYKNRVGATAADG